MKIKRMVKRLLAIGTGAVMLGATTMGALAATDLKSYPDMFVKDGTFDGYFVVGEKAAAVDNLAMTDIAASMKYKKATGTTAATVEGDAWLVGTSSKKFELANNNASALSVATESIRDINTFISDDEMAALGGGTWATNERDFGYNQYLFFDNTPASVSNGVSRIVKYVESDDDVTSDFFFVATNGQIARYRLEFTANAQSDVTDSAGAADTTGTYLDDFEDTSLSLMGKQYTVVQARRSCSAPVSDCIKLILMSGATTDTLLEGESKSYSVGDNTYDVTVTFVDADEAKFTVNGEATNKLRDGDTYVLSDKSEIGVSEVLYQDYAGGVHSTTFFLGARKVEIRDDNVNDGIQSHQMRVGSDDIDGADVIIEGSDDNTTFTISSINLNMTAEDDYFVGANAKLSDVIAAAGDEKQVLLDGGFDIEYKGLTEEKTHDIGIKTSSVRRYKLTAHDGDGNKVEIPVAYASATSALSLTNVTLGEEAYSGTRANQKRLILKEGESFQKDDYFILTGASTTSGGAVNGDGSGKSYLLQYRGSDRQTKTSPKIRFKNLGSTETLEYSVASLTGTGITATIKLGGFSFVVQNESVQGGDDFNISVDLNGNGWAMDSVNAVGTGVESGTVTFVDYYGAEIGFRWNSTHVHNDTMGGQNGTVGGVGGAFIGINISVPDGNDFDNVAPTLISFNITGTSDPEVRVSTPTGLTLLTPEGKSSVSYGYTSMGGFMTFDEPSGDPDELTINWPEKQRLPQVYITSGATKSGTTTGGDLTAVTIVDATKLDSEVASLTAQNVVAVGGPCVNTVAAELLGNPADCTTGFMPGKARVKLFEHANGKVAMLVAGYSGADTRLAGKVVAHRASELTGMEVEVEGTTYSDATISTPAAE